jgi:hypothetical protein
VGQYPRLSREQLTGDLESQVTSSASSSSLLGADPLLTGFVVSFRGTTGLQGRIEGKVELAQA